MKVYRPILEDDIELCDANGDVVKTLHYKIDVNQSYKEITARRMALTAQADAALKTGDENATYKMGQIFIELLNAIFGAETTNELLDWYDDGANLIWMLMPFLMDNIFPALERQRQQVMLVKEMENRYAPKQETDNAD